MEGERDRERMLNRIRTLKKAETELQSRNWEKLQWERGRKKNPREIQTKLEEIYKRNDSQEGKHVSVTKREWERKWKERVEKKGTVKSGNSERSLSSLLSWGSSRVHSEAFISPPLLFWVFPSQYGVKTSCYPGNPHLLLTPVAGSSGNISTQRCQHRVSD